MIQTRTQRLALALCLAHIVALIFGLVGIVIMLPNPDLWASDPNAVDVFNWSMEYAGSLHIILGALAMLVAGGVLIGWKKTAIFAAVTYPLSLTSELIGTGTGWPFGNYSYTDFLGAKVLGHVPYTIPMSWFYMGLASYLLGIALVARLPVRRVTAWEIGAGVWFLTVWDLVLDPAMAHPELSITFWEWHQSGAYFGMPFRNLIGWSVTGFIFIAMSRWLWRERAELRGAPTFPLVIYVANMAFAVVLSANAGLWWPIVLATALGTMPALIAWRPSGTRRFTSPGVLRTNE